MASQDWYVKHGAPVVAAALMVIRRYVENERLGEQLTPMTRERIARELDHGVQDLVPWARVYVRFSYTYDTTNVVMRMVATHPDFQPFVDEIQRIIQECG